MFTAPKNLPASFALVSAAIAIGANARLAVADVVYLDQGMTVSGARTAMNANYRFSQSNWDQSINNGVASGTNQSTFNMGNVPNTVNRTFSFSLMNRAGEGLVWTVGDAASSKTLAWGTFAGGLPAGTTTKATMNTVAAPVSYNALRLEGIATVAGMSLDFGSLAFSSATLGVNGAPLQDGHVTSANGAAGQVRYLTADTNMALHNWTLTGTFTGVRASSGGGDDNLRLQVVVLDGTVVPAPGVLALLGVAFTAPSRRRRD